MGEEVGLMSFGDGNLRKALRDLDARNTALNLQLADMRQQRDGLVCVARFMADRLAAAMEGTVIGPASWSYIVRELRKLGVEVER